MLQPRPFQPKSIFGTSGKDNNISVGVKIPELYNIALNNDTVSDALMQFLLFEQLSGQEILSVSRADMLNGQNLSYNIVSNLRDVASEYSSSNIISIPNSLPDLFKNYGIVLENYVPELSIAADSITQIGNESPNAYVNIDPASNSYNSVIVEFKNLQANQSIEIQIVSAGIAEDTLYDFTVV